MARCHASRCQANSSAGSSGRVAASESTLPPLTGGQASMGLRLLQTALIRRLSDKQTGLQTRMLQRQRS